MRQEYHGSFIHIEFDANELPDGRSTIPDPHYFDKAFEPILVTGDDGNEYNVIPSDRFK